jgi:cysteinyl-tRNA synthetase
VKFVQNVTDIDDKILAKSQIEGIHWRDHAKKYEGEFFAAYDSLGVLLPDEIPHATDYIPEQIELIQQLIDRGYAYETNPGSGDVWFDTAAWADYGELTNQQNAADLEASEEDARADKRNPRDFALWKAPKPGDPEDAVWDSPWGAGRPGWHLECSAMSGKLLGDEFDIHGGGLDLRFPHHENETAQSRAAGRGFVKYWMHSAWVTAKGEKMSKSLGNGLSVTAVLASPLDAFALRYALAAVHYRSMQEWTDDTLPAAKKTLQSLHRYLTANSVHSTSSDPLPAEFRAAMDADFNTSQALAVVHGLAKDPANAPAVAACLDVLGLNPLNEQWAPAFETAAPDVSADRAEEIEALIQERTEAKAARNFARADEIRDELLEQKIQLTDTADGTSWAVV